MTLLVGDAQLLNDYAVRYRYPGIDATKKQSQMAAKAAGRLRDYIALVDKVIRILIVYGKIKRVALAAPGAADYDCPERLGRDLDREALRIRTDPWCNARITTD